MAKPRIFISSTYYDLKYIRKDLENFIENMGYEPILFESGDIPFHPDLPLDESCSKEIENSNMQVLIIGGRYGSKISYPEEEDKKKKDVVDDKMYEFYNSITKKEYQEARTKGIPIFVFVDRGVYNEYETYKRNKGNSSIKYAHVDSINIFKLLDEIISHKLGNYVKDFDNFEDIAQWLKDQWAGLFADYLSKRRDEMEIKTISSQISELEGVTKTLKEYIEAIMRQVKPENYENIIETEEKKLERRKAEKFYNNDAIKFLRHRLNIKSDSLSVYNTFKKANTVEEFLRELGIISIKFDKLCANLGVEPNEFEDVYFDLKREFDEEQI